MPLVCVVFGGLQVMKFSPQRMSGNMWPAARWGMVGSVMELYEQIHVNGASTNVYTIWLMGRRQRVPVHSVGPAWALPALSAEMKWDGKPPFIPSNIQATALGIASATRLWAGREHRMCFSWQTHVCLTWSSLRLANWTIRLWQTLFFM